MTTGGVLARFRMRPDRGGTRTTAMSYGITMIIGSEPIPREKCETPPAASEVTRPLLSAATDCPSVSVEVPNIAMEMIRKSS